MPLYTYRCTNPDCQKEIDLLHGINEGGHPKCPECQYPCNKLLSAVPHRFEQKRGTMGVKTYGPRGITRDDISN